MLLLHDYYKGDKKGLNLNTERNLFKDQGRKIRLMLESPGEILPSSAELEAVHLGIGFQ